jgi:hypothetical protein
MKPNNCVDCISDHLENECFLYHHGQCPFVEKMKLPLKKPIFEPIIGAVILVGLGLLINHLWKSYKPENDE